MFKSKTTVTFVQSPFQLICAIEARAKQLAESEHHLIIVFKERSGNNATTVPRNLQQIQNFVDDGWTSVRCFGQPSHGGVRRTLRRVIIGLSVLYLYKGRLAETTAMVGDFRSGWLRWLARRLAKETVLLDDGLSSIPLINVWGSPTRTIDRVTRTILFTAFAPTDIERLVVRNDFAKLSLGFADKKLETDQVALIGGKLSEARHLSLEVELNYLGKALAQHKGRTVIYYAHREESEDKLNRLRQAGVKIEILDVPIEVHFSKVHMLPANVLGICSTVLATTRLLAPGVSVAAIRVPAEYFSANNRKEFDAFYSYLASIGVRVQTF